jgi:4-hydroxy-tetrahydrodipicolinate reductase
MKRRRYRVAQWATGHTGMRSLQTVIEHPLFELVGLYVYSDEKVGRDAGEIAGRAPTGVIATRDVTDIIAARPDCVLYMPLLDHTSTGDMVRLLEAGINIVTTSTEFHHPPTLEPARREALEAACRRGGASLYETGPGPGFIETNLPLTAMLLMRRLDRLRIDQFADLSGRNSPAFIRKFFGVDMQTDMSDVAARSIPTDGAALRQLADTIGLPLDAVTTGAKPAMARTTTKIAVATIEAGSVGGWQMDVIGWRDGRPLMTYSRTMYVVKDLDPAWELRDTGWRVKIEGDAPLDIDIRFAREGYDPISPGYNAHIAVNAVPAVVEAEPGIRIVSDLRLFPVFAAD